MVTRYLKLFAATVVALFALAACQNERTIDLYGEEGDPTSMDVVFNVKTFDEVSLRTHLRPENEHRIENIVIWVFDKQGIRIGKPIISHDPSGDFGFVPRYTASPQTPDASTDKGVPFGGTDKKGQVGGEMKLRLKNLSDQVTIVALANFTSQNFALENSQGATLTRDDQFANIEDIEELRALRLNINRANHDFTTTERIESPLMYAMQKVTSEDVNKELVSIQLIPYIAKITTEIKSGDDVTINAIRYHYQSIPTYTNLYSAIAKNQDASKIRPLNTRPTQMIVSEKGEFRSEGYLMPNYAAAHKLITKEIVADAQKHKTDKGYKSGFTAFDLRQKRVKTASQEIPNKFDNGEWEFAPKEATAFVMQADLTINKGDGTEQHATVDYTIVLGDFSKVTSWTNPLDLDLEKINNYFIESATHYKYTITINGVDNIIVEASSPDKLDEPNPSVEGGTVVGDKAAFVLDSHYEQRTTLINASDFDIFSDVNTRKLKPKAELHFLVETPFQSHTIMSYDAAQANSARMNGVPKEKQVDNDWIRIYVHDPKLQKGGYFDNTKLPNIIYSKTVSDARNGLSVGDYWNKTLTVEQFFAWLLSDPDPLFDVNNNICITIFVDEYYYDWDPSQIAKSQRTHANKQPDLWKRFANAPDRKFFLLTDNIQSSADQKSTYIRGTFLSLIQHSIKTFFTESPEGVRVWGVESIDETPNIQWSYLAPGRPSRWISNSVSNGWLNTWNVLGATQYTIENSEDGTSASIGGYSRWLKEAVEKGEYIKRTLVDKYVMSFPNDAARENGKDNYPQEDIWAITTVGAPGGTYFNPKRKGIFEAFKQDVASFTPFLRNRDVNRDGLMQANEMKWYIPSEMEAEMLVMFEQALPGYARLKAPLEGDFKNELVLYSSSAYLGNKSVYSSNPVTIIVPRVSTVPMYQATMLVENRVGQTIPANKMHRLRATTRLIRDLGIIEKSSIEDPSGFSYNFSDKYFVANDTKMMRFVPNLDDKTEQSNTNNYGGYFIGEDHLNPSTVRYAFADSELPRHNERDSFMRVYYKGFKLSSRFIGSSNFDSNKKFRWDYDELRGLFLIGKSPCYSYYENSDKSDLGQWRLPNLSELTILGLSTPSLTNYIFGNNKKNGDQVFNVWASTIPSRKELARDKTNGFFMRVGPNLCYPMPSDTPGYGDQVTDWSNYVRCVRDLTDAEWQAAKKRK